MPWIGAIGAIVFALIGITYTFILRQKTNAIIVEDKKLLLVDATPLPVRPQSNDYVQAKLPERSLLEPTETSKLVDHSSEQKISDKVTNETEEAQKRFLIHLTERRLTKMEAALDADSAISFTLNTKPTLASKTQNNNSQTKNPESLFNRYGVEKNSLSYQGNGIVDPNMQEQKIAFLSRSSDADVYLKNTHQEAIKANLEIKAGTIIPSVMISGVNSDLPGQIIAQVKESVYDSATGQNVLIPIGSRLVGTYDSCVTTGQKRALIAWSRVIYPDGSSLSLGNMPGVDQSGYAGFRTK
ncbi:type IV secretion system protein VirB10 [Bartonella sp. Coyote22sub2]|nr:TrbI/VirB10 family protein [Bartonella sp. 114]AQX22508.1 type IV secretion system protein VirB10 [Bartonella sp. 11B]AQX24210.1 type IV secretion system protein VirB10 [Bartonella sp. 114]AQX24957.1 type IV secretion system protein VirB10 [Bartonella sp. Coyote22sub2]